MRLVENPKGESAAWRRFLVKEVGGKIRTEDAVCRSCKATIKTGGGTSNLAQHLRRYHPLQHSLLSPKGKSKSRSNEPESKDGEVVECEQPKSKPTKQMSIDDFSLSGPNAPGSIFH